MSRLFFKIFVLALFVVAVSAGFAQAAIHLGEYRKMRPGPIEEFLFYDHPSGYNRIRSAMVWKSQNLDLVQPSAPSATKP